MKLRYDSPFEHPIRPTTCAILLSSMRSTFTLFAPLSLSLQPFMSPIRSRRLGRNGKSGVRR